MRSDTTSQYRYSGLQINPWFLFRLGESNFFAGPQVDLNYDHMYDPAKYLVDQPSYKAAGGTDKGYKNFSSGVGFLLTYDTRDVPANAYRGMYLDFRGMMYQKFLGSDNNFYRPGDRLPPIQDSAQTWRACLDGTNEKRVWRRPSQQIRSQRYSVRSPRLLHGPIS